MHACRKHFETYLDALHGGKEAWDLSPRTVCWWWDQKRRQAKPVDELGEDAPCKEDLELPPPLAWFWARALNLASILEVKMAVALAALHPLPHSELAALVLVASEAATLTVQIER